MNKLKLTKKQTRVLEIIRDKIVHDKYPPTVREIAAEMGLSHPSAVISHLKALVKKGCIERTKGSARGIRLLRYPEESGNMKDGVVYASVVGEIAAGLPITARQNIEELMPVSPHVAKNKKVYLLKVKGDSMIGEHILDGDLVVVNPEIVPQNGDIVVALIDDEATVKKFYKKADHIILQPANSNYEPIIMRKNFRVQGKVISIIRQP